VIAKSATTTIVFYFFLLFFLTEKAHAACDAASTTSPALIPLGVQSAQAAAAGNITSARATFTIDCGVQLLSLELLLLSSNRPYYTASNDLVLTQPSSTDQIPYRLSSSSNFNPSITAAGQSIGQGGTFTLLSLDILGSRGLTVPIFIQSLPLTRWPKSGRYQATQLLVTGGSICTLAIAICLGSLEVKGTVTVQIDMTVNKTCEFGTVDSQVNFGNHPFVRDIPAQTLNAQVRCTNQDTYRLYATNGAHYGNGHRQMDRGGQQKIGYEIYHPGSTTQILSASNPQQRTGTGLIEIVALPVRVLPGQATPMIGEYSDSIQLVLEF